MKTYDLHIRVSDKSLTTVIDVLKNAAEIVSLKQIVEEDEPKKPQPRKARSATTTAQSTLLQIMQPGVVYNGLELGKKIAEKGYSPKSIYPALSQLVQDRKVERIAANTYLVKA